MLSISQEGTRTPRAYGKIINSYLSEKWKVSPDEILFPYHSITIFLKSDNTKCWRYKKWQHLRCLISYQDNGVGACWLVKEPEESSGPVNFTWSLLMCQGFGGDTLEATQGECGDELSTWGAATPASRAPLAHISIQGFPQQKGESEVAVAEGFSRKAQSVQTNWDEVTEQVSQGKMRPRALPVLTPRPGTFQFTTGFLQIIHGKRVNHLSCIFHISYNSEMPSFKSSINIDVMYCSLCK